MSNSLGIYFGLKLINIVEAQAKKVVNNLQLPLTLLSGPGLEEKVPDDLKIVALLKDEFRKNKIEIKEAGIAISGKDLIIRTFDMPVIPKDELEGAVNFEVKKYIPFKVEDLVSDFQVEFDRASRRNLVLFAGIKKETLDKYISIFSQLNIKVASLEYSAFSILRILKMGGVGERGTVGVVGADFKEKDEVNFTVLNNGFPLFSRDIILSGEAAPAAMSIPAGSEVSSLLEKLKTEIRISLDYYERIFPNKKIDKMFYLCEQACYADLAVFSKDIGLPAHFVDVQRYAGKDIPFSLSFYKGYGASLSKAVRAYLKINILAKYEESRAKKAAVKLDSGSFLSGITLDSRALIAGVAICLVPYLYGFFRSVPIKKALAMAIIKRSSVATVDPNATLEDLGNIDSKYKEKINKWAQLISGQTYLTQIMEALPRILPRGSRITGFSFRNKGADNELSLQGIIYLGDRDREISTVNNLIKDLKTDTVFGKYFKSATINSLEHNPGGRPPTTSFSILLQ